MAQAKNIAQFNSFVGGLLTESTELTFPPNASLDELNCEIFTKGNRTRRRGFDFETNYALSSYTLSSPDFTTLAIHSDKWTSVGGVGEKNFTVVQIGATLYFYDALNALSTGEESFTVNLDSYLAPEASTASTEIVSMVSGRGDLFVVSPLIEPIRITYNSGTNNISVEEIEIKIRDFEGVDDGLDVDEEPSTLSALHEYNLRNQGWYVTPSGVDNIEVYQTAQGVYPANNMQWHLAVQVRGDVIAPGVTVSAANQGKVNSYALRKLALGNGEAPKGHYVIDPFNKNRSAVSGISGITTESTTERPNCVTFYAGRVAYAFKGDLYLSQVLNRSRDNAGKCYQEMDPTSEDLSDLVASDGVVIPLPDAGSILAMEVIGSTLLIFANNGVWYLSGTDGGFKATDFLVGKVTSAGIVSRTGLVNAEGTLVWWSDSGIYGMRTEQITGTPQAQNLTDTTIKTFYLGISNTARKNAVGSFDPSLQTITWLYSSDEVLGRHQYDRILKFNLTLGAFYPWSVVSESTELSELPFIAGATELPQLSLERTEMTLYDSTGDVITTDMGEVVTYGETSFTENSSFIKYLVIVPQGSDNYKVTFGAFTNQNLTDWEKYAILEGLDEGLTYQSYLLTGYDLQQDLTRMKQAPYVIVHTKRTETAYDFDNNTWTQPSGLFLNGRWDFTDTYKQGKWSVTQQVYKILNKDIPTEDVFDYDFGNNVITARVRVRGRGRSLQLYFSSDGNKDFNLLGWGIVYTGNTEV